MKNTTKKTRSLEETLTALEKENKRLREHKRELQNLVQEKLDERDELCAAAHDEGFREHALVTADQFKYVYSLVEKHNRDADHAIKRWDATIEALEGVINRILVVDFKMADNTAIVTTMGGWEVFSEGDEDARRTLIDVLSWQVANKILAHYRMNAESLTATVRKSLEGQQ